MRVLFLGKKQIHSMIKLERNDDASNKVAANISISYKLNSRGEFQKSEDKNKMQNSGIYMK